MKQLPRFPYQDGSLSDLPTNFGFTQYLPFETFASVMENEFKLKYKGTVEREYEVVVLNDRAPNGYEPEKFNVLSFQSTIDENSLELAYSVNEKPTNLVVLKNDPGLIEKILARFQFYDLTFAYKSISSEAPGVQLKDLFETFKKNNVRFEWSLQRNSSDEEILLGKSQLIPEFISVNHQEEFYISFLFPQKVEHARLFKSYESLREAAYNTEHSVASIRDGALQKIDVLLSEVLRQSSVLQAYHDCLTSNGFKIKMGRSQPRWLF